MYTWHKADICLLGLFFLPGTIPIPIKVIKLNPSEEKEREGGKRRGEGGMGGKRERERVIHLALASGQLNHAGEPVRLAVSLN